MSGLTSDSIITTIPITITTTTTTPTPITGGSAPTSDGTTYWASNNESYTLPSTYFPDQSRKNLRSLVDHMPDSDAEKTIQKLFIEITKENSDFRLTADIENALTQMTLDRSVGEVIP